MAGRTLPDIDRLASEKIIIAQPVRFSRRTLPKIVDPPVHAGKFSVDASRTLATLRSALTESFAPMPVVGAFFLDGIGESAHAIPSRLKSPGHDSNLTKTHNSGGVLFAIVAFTTGCRKAATPAAPPEPTVEVTPVEAKTIPIQRTFSGTVQAVESVDIVPQITGYLEEILYTEGALVREGDPLFLIDPRPAGAKSRQSLGTVVVFGMIAATNLIVVVPIFYVVIQTMREHFGCGKPSAYGPEL